MKSLSVGPRLGRDYKAKAEVEAAFRAGVDFTSFGWGSNGLAVNLEDALAAGVDTINARYAKLTKVHVFKIGA